MLRGTGTGQEDKMNGSVAEFRVDLLVSGQMSGSPALRNSQNKSGTGTKSMREGFWGLWTQNLVNIASRGTPTEPDRQRGSVFSGTTNIQRLINPSRGQGAGTAIHQSPSPR